MTLLRHWSGGAALWLALCAGRADGLAAQDYRAVVRLRPRSVPVALDTVAVPYEIAAQPALVYPAVRAAFRALGIRVDIQDSARGLLGTERWVRRSTLAGEPMSRFFNCGASLIGSNADRYTLTIAVAAFVDPLPEGRTRLGIAATAMGRDVEGASLDPVGCETTGLLESRLATATKAKLVLPGPS